MVVARKVASFAQDGDVIGAGSGSTSFLTLQELGRRVKEDGLQCKVIPTSREMEMTAAVLGVEATTLMEDKPDCAMMVPMKWTGRATLSRAVAVRCTARSL